MSATLYSLRDEMADVLGIGSIGAHDAPMRFMLNGFLKAAQDALYWDRYSLPSLLQYWPIYTVQGINKYPYPGGAQSPLWAANTQYNVQDLVTDANGNTQVCTSTGVSGAGAPAWAVALYGATADGTAQWMVLAVGAYIVPKLEPRKTVKVALLYNNAWLPMQEGIPPYNYTLTSQQYPQRYAHRAGPLIEFWPTPSAAFQVMLFGYQQLQSFTKDLDTTTLDDRLVFYKAAYLAKTHPKFKQADASVYATMALQLQRELAAAAHGQQRFIPGVGSGLTTRAQPTIGNPR